jgi:hypothetical protein
MHVNNGTHAMPIQTGEKSVIEWQCPELKADGFLDMESLIEWVHKQELWNQPYNPFSDERLERVTLQRVYNGRVMEEYTERVI